MIIKCFENYNGKKEEMDKIYKDSLQDDYWVEISDLFPDYNSPDSEDCKKAVDFIYSKMADKYKDIDLDEQILKSKIHGGIT